MKKYITLAALLTAGAAFANAEIEVWDFDGQPGPITTPIKFGEYVSPYSWNVTSAGLTWAGGTAESFIFSIDAASIDTTKNYSLFSVQNKNYGSLSGVAVLDGQLTFSNWGKSDETADWNTISAGATDLTFVISRTASNAYGMEVYANGNFDSSVASLSVATSGWAFTGSDITNLEFGATSGTYAVDSMPENTEVSAYTLLRAGYTSGSVATKEALVNYYVSAIPEPSAFGLLAGLGALALVGTRRRRK